MVKTSRVAFITQNVNGLVMRPEKELKFKGIGHRILLVRLSSINEEKVENTTVFPMPYALCPRLF